MDESIDVSASKLSAVVKCESSFWRLALCKSALKVLTPPVEDSIHPPIDPCICLGVLRIILSMICRLMEMPKEITALGPLNGSASPRQRNPITPTIAVPPPIQVPFPIPIPIPIPHCPPHTGCKLAPRGAVKAKFIMSLARRGHLWVNGGECGMCACVSPLYDWKFKHASQVLMH